MALSARNQLSGKIEDLKLGDVMAHVVVRVGDNLIESVITRTSADELNLKVGDSVTLAAPPRRLHIFNPATGLRVAANGAPAAAGVAGGASTG